MSCLTAVKSHVIMYYETVYERSRKNKISGEVLSKMKSRGLQATSLSDNLIFDRKNLQEAGNNALSCL